MQADVIVQRQHALVLPQRGPGVMVGAVLVRDQRIEAVVAAGQLHQDEDPAVWRGVR